MDNIVTKVQTKKNLFFDKNAETNIKVKNTNNLPTTNTFDIMYKDCLLYTSPSPRDATLSRMPSSA